MFDMIIGSHGNNYYWVSLAIKMAAVLFTINTNALFSLGLFAALAGLVRLIVVLCKYLFKILPRYISFSLTWLHRPFQSENVMQNL